MANQTVSKAFLERYQTFCRSPFRGPAKVEEELQQLLIAPGVAQVAFHKSHPNTLVVAFERILIPDSLADESPTVHDVGEFLAYIIRERLKDGTWRAEYFLQNLTPCVASETSIYMHPHMSSDYNEELQALVAKLCISQGQYEIFQSIRQGELHTTVTLINRLLHSLGPGIPYHDIKLWPIWEGTSHAK